MAREDELRARIYTEDSIQFAVSTVTNRSAQLPVGIYQLTSDVAFYFRQGDDTVVALSGDPSSNPVWAQAYAQIEVNDPGTEGYVAAISQGGTGKVWILQPQP